jgi:hypothetical protein
VSARDPHELAEDPVIRALADAIRTEDWTRVDLVWNRARNRPREQGGSHLRRDAEPDPRDFLRKALADAQRLEILPAFVRELARENLLTEDFPRLETDVSRAIPWELEQFQNNVDLLKNAVLDYKDQMAACDYVCRIDIDGQPTGSGIQVSARLVATAAHVIEPLVARRPDGALDLDYRGSLRAADDSLRRLVVRFGYAWDYASEDSRETHLTPGEVVFLHSDWLSWGSQPALSDRSLSDVRGILGISITDGPWDVALIRLARPRRTLMPIPRLLNSYPPAGHFAITVLHHPSDSTPDGPPLGKSAGVMSAHLGWPPLRSLHTANTRPGSSGAPVFNCDWQVVALHQGGVRVPQHAGALAGAPSAGTAGNRAVPVWGWRRHVKELEDWLGDGFTYLTSLTTSTDLEPRPYPVFGRRETQERVQRAALPDATPEHRLLIIRGEAGAGLRFTKRLIRDLVASTDGVVAVLDLANALNDSADGFAERISGALSAAEKNLQQPDQPALTTGQRAIRDYLVPVLGQRLERTARDRAKWLVLECMGDASAGIPAVVTDVVNGLISRLRDFRTLRLVLVGWPYTPPGYERSIEELRPVTADDLVRYFWPAGDDPDPETVEAIHGYFALTVKEAGAGYPTAHRIARQIAPKFQQQLHTELRKRPNREPAHDAVIR